jgi:hypothetical protein
MSAGRTFGALENHHRQRQLPARDRRGGGAQPLTANRITPGPWEAFDLIDAGDGTVAPFSHANDRFVTAENSGNSALIANRTAGGAWEQFTVLL